MTVRTILFEMNEVPGRILDHFVEHRPGSALARVIAGGRVYETFAEDAGHLSPWITWPSLHRGISNEQHFISDFGQSLDDVDTAFPPLWTLLQRAGVNVGVFNSLHTYPLPGQLDGYAFYVPDPFASGHETHPKSIEPFQALNLSLSRGSGRNVSGGVPVREALKLVGSLPSLGVRVHTVAQLARQIGEERLAKWKLVRRRTYQSVLSFDIFFKQLTSTRPQFSTFFTNHVASAMHRYWAASFPEDWVEDNGFDDAWRSRFSGEILFALDKLDAMIARLLALVSAAPGWRLMIASSMGQAAVDVQPVETIVNVADGEALLSKLGVWRSQWTQRPAMVPQFNITVVAAARRRFVERMEGVRIAGAPLDYRTDGDGFFSLDFGQINLPDDAAVEIAGETCSMEEAGLANMEIQDRAGSSAYHIPEGTLIVYDGTAPSRDRPQISALDIAPSILASFDIAPPEYMRAAAAL